MRSNIAVGIVESMPHEFYPQLIARGAELLEGEHELARYLHAELWEVRHWRHGLANPPARVLPRLSELLVTNRARY